MVLRGLLVMKIVNVFMNAFIATTTVICRKNNRLTFQNQKSQHTLGVVTNIFFAKIEACQLCNKSSITFLRSEPSNVA